MRVCVRVCEGFVFMCLWDVGDWYVRVFVWDCVRAVMHEGRLKLCSYV